MDKLVTRRLRGVVSRVPDTPRIEQAHVVIGETQDALSFQEEGTLLFIECLEGREIHNRRIRLHLAKIRVERKIDGEIA